MTNRKAKRLLNESDEWILFTRVTKNDQTEMVCSYSKDTAWEILLNLAVEKYHIRETLRNILKFTDDHLKDQSDSGESE